MNEQLTRLLTEFDVTDLARAGAQLDDTLLHLAENVVLFWAGQAELILTFNTTAELESYEAHRRTLVDEGVVDEAELHIDALTILNR